MRTTEIGMVPVDVFGAADFQIKLGSRGKAVPGQRSQVQAADGSPSPVGEIRELMLWRRDRWETMRDLAKIDTDS